MEIPYAIADISNNNHFDDLPISVEIVPYKATLINDHSIIIRNQSQNQSQNQLHQPFTYKFCVILIISVPLLLVLISFFI